MHTPIIRQAWCVYGYFFHTVFCFMIIRSETVEWWMNILKKVKFVNFISLLSFYLHQVRKLHDWCYFNLRIWIRIAMFESRISRKQIYMKEKNGSKIELYLNRDFLFDMKNSSVYKQFRCFNWVINHTDDYFRCKAIL